MNNRATGNDDARSRDGALSIKNILIVDDDIGTAKALRATLVDAGYDVKMSHVGGEALKLVRDGFKPGAAILDVHLRDLSGLVLAQQLRQALGPEVPIIMMSGDTSMETLNSLALVGATHFFSKPMTANAIITRLRELLP